MIPPEVPTGGSTGCAHEPHSAAVDFAREWQDKQVGGRIGRPIVPLLRERFGLSTAEAIEAIRLANKRRAA